MTSLRTRLRYLWNVNRAISAGKTHLDLHTFLARMVENTTQPVIQDFALEAFDVIGGDVRNIEMEKEGVDFTNEATVLFHLGARWERHDMLTAADITSDGVRDVPTPVDDPEEGE